MLVSRNNLRVSLGFSQNDIKQVRVAEILKEKGRKKSKFITDAVLFYVENQYDPLPEKTAIKKIVKEVLDELNVSSAEKSEDIPSEYIDDSAPILKDTHKTNVQKEKDKSFSDEELGGFLDGLDMFG